MISIRRRLLLWLLGGALIASVLAAAAIYRQAQTEANRLFDYHLRQIALTVSDQVFDEQGIQGTLDEESEFDYLIQVWGTAGERLYYSHPHADVPRRAEPGLATVHTGEGAWRVYSLVSGDLQVQVSQPLRVRNQLAARLALHTLLPGLVLLPALGLLVWLTVTRGLRPLDRLARDLEARDSRQLDRVPEAGLPNELLPLVRALNGLLARLGHALETQRQFVGDAAHELRTPLTALQLQARMAERAKTDPERAVAFTELRSGLQRVTHLVQQLLALAGSEADTAEASRAPVELPDLLRAVVAEYAALAPSSSIDLGVAQAEPARVIGDESALRTLLGNLVGNAIRYTEAGGRVDVSCGVSDGKPFLEVVDDGPGIPEEERARVFDRFYRGVNTGAAGSGLGLAIVKNLAQRHGATVALAPGANGRGLAVRVEFPNGPQPRGDPPP